MYILSNLSMASPFPDREILLPACHWTSLKTWEVAVLHLIVICDGRSLGNP